MYVEVLTISPSSVRNATERDEKPVTSVPTVRARVKFVQRATEPPSSPENNTWTRVGASK